MPSNISYDSTHKTYYIKPGATVTDIALTARDAPTGATLMFLAGTHKLTDTLIIDRGDISLRGAGRDKTVIMVDHDDAEGIRFDGGDPVWQRKMTSDVTQGSKSFTIPEGVTLKAGDVVGLHMANDSSLYKYGPYEAIKNSEYWNEKPLRESLVQVDRVVGNTAYLKHEIAFDMTAGKTVLAKYDLLQNVHVSDLTVTYDLKEPKDYRLFDNPLGDYKQAVGILIEGTLGLDVRNVAVKNAASSGLIIRRALEPEVDNYLADGAINRGSDKNGYGLSIEETFYGRFTNLDLINVRHSFLFSGWNAEAYNDVHIRTMNRDVNYHGGPDHSNTVLVDYANYLDGLERDYTRKSWSIVDDGGEENPPTDISKNTDVFKVAYGSYRDELINGWDGGAYLDGRDGNDILIGGKGRDVLIGGPGIDYVAGKGGSDWFVVKPGDSYTVVTDFATGAKGDVLVLSGFREKSFSSLSWLQSGNDAKLYLDGAAVILKDVSVSALKDTNFAFTTTGVTPGPDTAGTQKPPASGSGTNGDDNLTGTHDDNSIHARGGNDTVTGRDGNDVLYGEDGNDVLYGDWNNDTLYGGKDRDILYGGYGNDSLYGGTENDRLMDDAGNDRLLGENGDDVLHGGSGDDSLNGGDGNDRLDGGDGRDYLYGGKGSDTFVFSRAPDAVDVLTDFTPGEDRLDLSYLLSTGAKAYVATVAGVSGLYIDPDGTGGVKTLLAAVFEDPLAASIRLTDLMS